MKGIFRGNRGAGEAVSKVDRTPAPTVIDHGHIYDLASQLFGERRYDEARRLFASLDSDQVTPSLRANAINDLAVLDSLNDRHHIARAGFKRALLIDPGGEHARRNLAMLESCGCGAEEDVT